MSKRRNKDNDIIISFVGGSRDNITGSSVLISYPIGNGEHKCICLECGMIQGLNKPEIEYSENKKMVENIPVKDISAVFVAHQHIDHTGSLSIFNENNGFNGIIITSEESMYITQDLLKDSVYLHENLVRYLRSIGKRPKPLYTSVDMYNMFDKMRFVDSHEIHKFDDWLSYEFYNSGHVVGGSQIKLYFKLPNNKRKSLVYTSDLGSSYNLEFKPFVKKMDVIPSANMYIFEATYSNAERCFSKKDSIEERRDLKKLIKYKILNGDRVFFPAFSFGRTQELMALMYDFFKDEEFFKDIPIVVDGKLTNTICNTYSKVLKNEDKDKWEQIKNWKNFRYNKDYDGTLLQLAKRECGIYISSSGFIQAKTRSCDYVKNFLGRENDLIVFVGFYGGIGSVGEQLVKSEKGDTIKIDNTTMIKHCDVVTYSSFSSHIQQDELISYFKQISTERILIHHIEEKNKKIFSDLSMNELMKIGKTTRVIPVSKNNSQFIL